MKKLIIAFAATAVAVPAVSPAPAVAQHYNRDWQRVRQYDYNRYEPGQRAYYADRYYRSGPNYRERRLSRNDRIYRGRDGRYYCRRNDGTTGLIVGAAVGGLIGNQVRIGGSKTLSTILGIAGGAALGQSLDRGNLRCR